MPPTLVGPGLISDAPAHAEHDVVNPGTERLRSILVVARAE
jgi:mannose-6-phosphate isomerase-like protein (cupin superfamily)